MLVVHSCSTCWGNICKALPILVPLFTGWVPPKIEVSRHLAFGIIFHIFFKIFLGSINLRSRFLLGDKIYMIISFVFLLLFFATTSLAFHTTNPMSGFIPGKNIQESIQNTLIHHQNGQFPQALEGYEYILNQLSSSADPKTASVKLSLHGNAGAIYLSQGEYDSARRHFESAIQLQPDNATARYNLAVLLSSKLNNHAGALKHCALAIKYSPSNHKAYHLMGNIMQNLGKNEEAEKYFNLAESIAIENNQEIPSRNTNEAANHQRLGTWYSNIISKSESFPQRSVSIDGKEYLLKVLSLYPLIMEVDSFVEDEDCAWICSKVDGKLEKSFTMGSHVVMKEGRSDDSCLNDQQCEDPSLFRSSYNAWLPRQERLQKLQTRIASLLDLPLPYVMQYSEDLQVVHYKSGGQFKVHQDSSSFHPRLLTALIYLNDPPANSGETWFPYAASRDSSLSTSQDIDGAVLRALNIYEEAVSNNSLNDLPGIKVTPKKGKAVIFFNHNSNGDVDPLAVHAGLPPRSSESREQDVQKWIANYWIQFDRREWICVEGLWHMKTESDPECPPLNKRTNICFFAADVHIIIVRDCCKETTDFTCRDNLRIRANQERNFPSAIYEMIRASIMVGVLTTAGLKKSHCYVDIPYTYKVEKGFETRFTPNLPSRPKPQSFTLLASGRLDYLSNFDAAIAVAPNTLARVRRWAKEENSEQGSSFSLLDYLLAKENIITPHSISNPAKIGVILRVTSPVTTRQLIRTLDKYLPTHGHDILLDRVEGALGRDSTLSTGEEISFYWLDNDDLFILHNGDIYDVVHMPYISRSLLQIFVDPNEKNIISRELYKSIVDRVPQIASGDD